jgi:hypothetical protein
MALSNENQRKTYAPMITEPVGRGVAMADEESPPGEGNWIDLVRRLQIFQGGMSPLSWKWYAEDVPPRTGSIDINTVHRHSNRMATEDIVTVDSLGSHARTPDYELTRVGKGYATALLYRYSKTLKTNPYAGLLSDSEVNKLYAEHMGIDLPRLSERLTDPTVKKHYPLRKLRLPDAAFDQYGI